MFMRLWLFGIGWALGILTVVLPWSWSNYSNRSAGQEHAKKCKETYPVTLGWDPDCKHLGQFYTDSTGHVRIYRDQADYEKARDLHKSGLFDTWAITFIQRKQDGPTEVESVDRPGRKGQP